MTIRISFQAGSLRLSEAHGRGEYELPLTTVKQENCSGSIGQVADYFSNGDVQQFHGLVRFPGVRLKVVQDREMLIPGCHFFAAALPVVGVKGKAGDGQKNSGNGQSQLRNIQHRVGRFNEPRIVVGEILDRLPRCRGKHKQSTGRLSTMDQSYA